MGFLIFSKIINLPLFTFNHIIARTKKSGTRYEIFIPLNCSIPNINLLLLNKAAINRAPDKVIKIILKNPVETCFIIRIKLGLFLEKSWASLNLELLFSKKDFSLAIIAKVGNIRADSKAVSFIKKISRFKKSRNRENNIPNNSSKYS